MFSENLDPALTAPSALWLWTPKGAAVGDNSKGDWAVACALNQNVSGASPLVQTIWTNEWSVPIKIKRIVSVIGTEFRAQIVSQPGYAFEQGEGAPIAQYNGGINLREDSTPQGRIALFTHAPSIYNQFQDLPYKDEAIFPENQEPLVMPGNDLQFTMNTYWPYNATWNCQYNFAVYFKF